MFATGGATLARTPSVARRISLTWDSPQAQD
jgi:hypothetical protein